MLQKAVQVHTESVCMNQHFMVCSIIQDQQYSTDDHGSYCSCMFLVIFVTGY